MTDTVKHMWDQVEKARADGTFSSDHAAVPAQCAEQPEATEPMGICDCGFTADECGTNHCMRKKIHLAGMTPGSKWPEGAPISKDFKTTGDGTGNGRTTKPELTGSPSGTPQGAGNFSERWEIGKNGWDASDEATREDI